MLSVFASVGAICFLVLELRGSTTAVALALVSALALLLLGVVCVFVFIVVPRRRDKLVGTSYS